MAFSLSKYQAGLFRLVLGLSVAGAAAAAVGRPLALALTLLGLFLAVGLARKIVAASTAICLLAAQFLTPSICPVPHLFLVLLAGMLPTGLGLSREGRPGAAYALPLWQARAAAGLLVALYLWTGVCLAVGAVDGLGGDLCYLTPALAGLPVGWLQPVLGTVLLVVTLTAFLPAARPVAWAAGAVGQCALLIGGSDAAVAGAVLALHVLVFDRRWLPGRVPSGGASLVLFDGVCVLCNRATDWLLAEDTDAVLSFAPLQGEAADALADRGVDLVREVSTIVYVRGFGGPDERVSSRSTAVLEILDDIGGIWRPFSWLRFVPRPLRDPAYRLVAENRYRWFGQYDVCRLPPPESRERFLS